jgi:hypothetical protein
MASPRRAAELLLTRPAVLVRLYRANAFSRPKMARVREAMFEHRGELEIIRHEA